MADTSQETKELFSNFYETIYKTGPIEAYNKYSSVYDKIIDTIDYPTKVFLKLLKEIHNIENEKFLEGKRVIDIGCGTGRIGSLLRDLSVKLGKLDGLDISKEMLEVCRTKNVYDSLINAPLTAQPTNGIAENQYDVALSFGCFIEGHIQMNGIFEMIRMTKPGGYVLFTLYDPHYTKDYMAAMGDIIKSKKAELIIMKLTPYKLDIETHVQLHGYYVIFKVL